MYEHLNTQQLISRLTGKNKSFIKRVSNTQENKYGNVDVFSASIETVPTRHERGDHHRADATSSRHHNHQYVIDNHTRTHFNNRTAQGDGSQQRSHPPHLPETFVPHLINRYDYRQHHRHRAMSGTATLQHHRALA